MSAFVYDGQAVERAVFDAVALDPQRSVVIEACAGSGKTWLLVARLLRLLLAGAAPGEILAITFTRKAAQEMRERLLDLLEQLAALDDAEVVVRLVQRGLSAAQAHAMLPVARGLLERVLTARAPMAIDTFHGWFGRIVRGAPLLSGIPAAFTLSEQTGRLLGDARRAFLDQVGRDAALRARYEDLLERVGEDSAWKLLRRLRSRANEWRSYLHGRDVEAALSELAMELGVDAETVDDPSHDPRASLVADAGFGERFATLASLARAGTDTEADRAAKAEAALEQLVTGFDIDTFEAMLALFKLKSAERSPKPTKKMIAAAAQRWGGNAEEELLALQQSLLDAALAARDAAAEREAYALNRAALHCAAAFIDAYEQIKRAQVTLDFDDLEWQAARLTRDDATAAYIQARLDARYKHLLIDEFQDTNPLQWATLRHWLDAYGADAARPTVFIVGDPKQSIYRFRRAEPRLFETAALFLRERFDAARLATNQTRRCAQAVVDAFNRSLHQAAYPAFTPHATTSAAPGEVWRLPPVPYVKQERAAADRIPALRDALTTPLVEAEAAQRDMEAMAVAQTIAAMVGVREITVDEAGITTRRLARFRDVLVLVRKRSTIAAFEQAFRETGIPYSSDRRGGLLATLEALDLSALLQFLVVPFSDLLLAHVLRTPIFGCTDQDLMRLAQSTALGSTWWERLQTLRGAARLDVAREKLTRWIALAGGLPVHDLLDRIYHEGCVMERYVGALPPAASVQQVRANLLAYIELALVLDSGRYPSLPRFIEELNELAAADDQESPDEGATDFGDTVRILTVHGAKGLEAPVVVLTDTCSSAERNDTYGVLIAWPPEDEAPRHMSVYGKADQRGRARRDIFDTEAELARLEDWNKLYVAATRAREVLIFSGIEPGRGGMDDSWYARFSAAAPLYEPPPVRNARHVTPGEAHALMIEDFRPRSMGVGVRVEEAQQAAQQAEAARLRGVALHRILEVMAGQRFDVSRAEGIAAACGVRGVAVQDVAEVAGRLLAAPALQRFFDPAQFRRARVELELLQNDGELLRLDRRVEFDDEVWVRDYKSRQGGTASSAQRAQVERYRDVILQLEAGALADGAKARRVRAALIFADASLLEI